MAATTRTALRITTRFSRRLVRAHRWGNTCGDSGIPCACRRSSPTFPGTSGSSARSWLPFVTRAGGSACLPCTARTAALLSNTVSFRSAASCAATTESCGTWTAHAWRFRFPKARSTRVSAFAGARGSRPTRRSNATGWCLPTWALPRRSPRSPNGTATGGCIPATRWPPTATSTPATGCRSRTTRPTSTTTFRCTRPRWFRAMSRGRPSAKRGLRPTR